MLSGFFQHAQKIISSISSSSVTDSTESQHIGRKRSGLTVATPSQTAPKIRVDQFVQHAYSVYETFVDHGKWSHGVTIICGLPMSHATQLFHIIEHSCCDKRLKITTPNNSGDVQLQLRQELARCENALARRTEATGATGKALQFMPGSMRRRHTLSMQRKQHAITFVQLDECEGDLGDLPALQRRWMRWFLPAKHLRDAGCIITTSAPTTIALVENIIFVIHYARLISGSPIDNGDRLFYERLQTLRTCLIAYQQDQHLQQSTPPPPPRLYLVISGTSQQELQSCLSNLYTALEQTDMSVIRLMRDGLVSSVESIAYDPNIGRSSLLLLATQQQEEEENDLVRMIQEVSA